MADYTPPKTAQGLIVRYNKGERKFPNLILPDFSDLSKTDLSEADLSKADLKGINLSEADLKGINLSEADLRGVNLSKADLSKADLRGAKLKGAILIGTILKEVIFEYVNVSQIEVSINIADEYTELLATEKVLNIVGEFMEAMGFVLKQEDEPVYGSFFQKLWFNFWKVATSQEVKDVFESGKKELKDVYSKIKTAAELEYLNAKANENTDKLADTTIKLLASLQPFKEVAIRMGTLLIVKVEKDGEAKLLIETISPMLAVRLEADPKFLQKPNAVYEWLQSQKEPQQIENEPVQKLESSSEPKQITE